MNLEAGILELVKDKNLSEQTILELLKESFEIPYKEIFGASTLILRKDNDTHAISFSIPKILREKVQDPRVEVALKQYSKQANLQQDQASKLLGQEVMVPCDPSNDFSPTEIANINQDFKLRLKNYAKDSIRYHYLKMKNKLVSGTIVKKDSYGNIFVDLGDTTAILPAFEQSPLEFYEVDDLIKGIVVAVYKQEEDLGRFRLSHNIMIGLSRKSKYLVEELFALEVPEIKDEQIEIKNIARIAGYKTKVAVSGNMTKDPAIVCVGPHGNRVLQVSKELGGEKIDVINYYEDDILKFISTALAPAQIEKIIIQNPEEKKALVLVDPEFLGYALGKKRQNKILASELTQWDIELKSTEFAEESDYVVDQEVKDFDNMFNTQLSALPSMSQELINILEAQNIFWVEDLFQAYKNNFQDCNFDPQTLDLLTHIIENNIEEEEEGTPLELLESFSGEEIELLKKNTIRSVEELVNAYQNQELETILHDKNELLLKITHIIQEKIEFEE